MDNYSLFLVFLSTLYLPVFTSSQGDLQTRLFFFPALFFYSGLGLTCSASSRLFQITSDQILLASASNFGTLGRLTFSFLSNQQFLPLCSYFYFKLRCWANLSTLGKLAFPQKWGQSKGQNHSHKIQWFFLLRLTISWHVLFLLWSTFCKCL